MSKIHQRSLKKNNITDIVKHQIFYMNHLKSFEKSYARHKIIRKFHARFTRVKNEIDPHL